MSDLRWWVEHCDAVEALKVLPDDSVDALVTDPPYPEIDRSYGRMTESTWHDMMRKVVAETRRVLKPTGSAVFILQANSEHVGRMRPWLWEFMAWTAREWNQIQDVWWWNPVVAPTVHCQRKYGLMRPSLKACVWLGPETCFRNQDKVLWQESDANKAKAKSTRALYRLPGGQSMLESRCASLASERGGTSPFNLIPLENSNSRTSGGAAGHVAATPLQLCDWWVRYLCPPSGLVLDPFAGSGTTGIAALKNDCHFVGIEREAEYVEIARQRINETWVGEDDA